MKVSTPNCGHMVTTSKDQNTETFYSVHYCVIAEPTENVSLSSARGWWGGLAPCFWGGNGGREEEGGGNSNAFAALTCGLV